MADEPSPEDLMASMEALLESRSRIQKLALSLREALDALYTEFPHLTDEDFSRIARELLQAAEDQSMDE